MKHLFVIFTLISLTFCAKEDLPDLNTLLDDPDALFLLEKRITDLLGELKDDDLPASPPGKQQPPGCEFDSTENKIIKTTESLARNATFLEDISNVTDARNCAALCCDHDKCDTSVYQNKDDHNCYLFHCGSYCVFTDHANYSMSTLIRRHTGQHSFAPGGATASHENDLQNLGSATIRKPKPVVTEPTPTKKTTASKPGLNQSCGSYSVKCNDSHAECLMGKCKCRVGYHEKNGICRQQCREEEFECKALVPGVVSRQCVHKSYLCDGNQDCTDGSDELGCVDTDKPAYLDSDLLGNVYNNPLYNLPYGSQSDAQYPYGFPIPGLNSQQQGSLYNNQLYPGLQSPNNAGGGYYLPAPGQAVNVPQTGNQLGGQWPFLDKPVNIGNPLYQNNLPYQTGQQTGYIPQQQPAQTGYVPVVQQPVQPVQQLKTNIQPVQQPVSQIGTGTVQQKPVQPVQQVPVMPRVQPAVQQQVTNPPVVLKPQPQPPTQYQQQNQNFPPESDQVEAASQQNNREPSVDRPRYPNADFDDSYSSDETNSAQQTHGSASRTNLNPQADLPNVQKSKTYGRFDDDGYQRHSSEIDDVENKPQPTEAVKSQAPEKTEQKSNKGKTNSEGYIDYSWIGYDSDSPRINGKKGPPRKGGDNRKPQKTTKKPTPTVGHTKPANIKQEARKPVSDDTDKSRDRVSDDKGGYDTNGYPDRFRPRYDDFDRQSNNRRPPYDSRYPDQYNSNTRHRPSHGSRYPFYESNYGRGRDRNPYPVWDSMKAEYYYPDDYEDKDFSSVQGMGGMGAGQQGADYPYVKTEDRVSDSRQHNTKPKVVNDVKDSGRPMVTEAPKKPEPATEAPAEPAKQIPVTTPKPVPVEPQQPVQPEETDSSSEESQSSDDKEEADSSSNESAENQSADMDSKASNATKLETSAGGSGQFKFMNVKEVEVDSFTDNSQGPIVALSLGLAITVMLLIFVGCRLRTVKRRLRKGRALHSNEADYLINGMYL